jgi:hypothetical protein
MVETTMPIKVHQGLNVSCSAGLVVILQKPYREKEQIAWQAAPHIAREVGKALIAAADWQEAVNNKPVAVTAE